MKLLTLALLEAALSGFTHRFEIELADLAPGTTGGAALTLDLLSLKAGTLVENVALHVPTLLSDASDGDFDDVTIKVGDADDDDRYLTATQIAAAAGSPVAHKAGVGPYVTPAAAVLKAVFTPEAGKAVANLDGGRVIVFARIVELQKLSF